MKKISILILMLTAFMGCREEFDDIGEPFDRASGISGTWTLSSVIQNDEGAISKGFPLFVQSLDITNRAGFSDYTLVLNQNEDGSPTTFEEQNTNAPSIIGISSGSWKLDDPEVPETITFSGDSGEEFKLTIRSYIGLNEGQLSLKLTRFSNGKPVLSYVYNFEK
ncbi:DUF5004 domain-containing protein [Fulvivirga sp. RKSG066]|uniref:DUF5004 domain-containing protein n=1 Tax=Fulvivirga aurantia TaxID=2529383 RepID=UPI0012BC9305|nr:DUF5004 domain-containing protein [Fulvivirga aurantia]MTI22286.1 DUF5004 domain-containing protein [Fulvivirga aurantia]